MLGGMTMRQGFGWQCGQNNGADIGGGATVGGAGRQSGAPHFFIRQPVGAHDRSSDELPGELLNIIQIGELKVQNSHVSAVSGDRSAKFIQIASHIDRTKMVKEGLDQ